MIAVITNVFHPLGMRASKGLVVAMLAMLAVLPACTGVNTFPTVARAGDTVSVMIGGSELARKETVSVTLTDAASQTWDLKSLGLVRSVFNLRTEGTAYGMHYSPYLNVYMPWFSGHEPLQTVLVTDLPSNVTPGQAALTVTLNATDNSSGAGDPFVVKLDVISGTGSSDQFLRKQTGVGTVPVDFTQMESAPHAKISFASASGLIIGAASLTLSFNSTVLNGNDINVYCPESTVRGSVTSTGAFGKTQRMVYWRQSGQNLYLDVIAPQGIDGTYLKLYIIHPRGLTAAPNFTLTSASVYGTDGLPIVTQPTLQYFP